jgi:3-methyl-2-oxobutanoate hydroxymethyltransferase
MKQDGDKIAVLTAYDASFAHCLEAAGVEVVLVGDSLGMVLQGRDSTLAVSVDDMVYHTRCVSAGLNRPMLIADMPFMSTAGSERALSVAGRLMAEGGAKMVKLEGGGEVIGITRRLTRLGIPVCAHLGLTPQSVHQLGGYRVQGRNDEAAERLLEDAQALEQAGASMLVLECVPTELAKSVSEALVIPTIGIGAGIDCDGQVLVLHDMLGITPGRRPKFSRDFLAGTGSIAEALSAYVAAVKNGEFPTAEESFS